MSKAADGLHSWCRPCINEYQKAWRKDNPIQDAATCRRWRLKATYGITPEQYNDMLRKQKGECAICFSTDPRDHSTFMHIDHDHDTGLVRGLLCGPCNKALGGFHDQEKLLLSAVAYLRSHLNVNLQSAQQGVDTAEATG